jgi:hypothetical protein
MERIPVVWVVSALLLSLQLPYSLLIYLRRFQIIMFNYVDYHHNCHHHNCHHRYCHKVNNRRHHCGHRYMLGGGKKGSGAIAVSSISGNALPCSCAIDVRSQSSPCAPGMTKARQKQYLEGKVNVACAHCAVAM